MSSLALFAMRINLESNVHSIIDLATSQGSLFPVMITCNDRNR